MAAVFFSARGFRVLLFLSSILSSYPPSLLLFPRFLFASCTTCPSCGPPAGGERGAGSGGPVRTAELSGAELAFLCSAHRDCPGNQNGFPFYFNLRQLGRINSSLRLFLFDPFQFEVVVSLQRRPPCLVCSFGVRQIVALARRDPSAVCVSACRGLRVCVVGQFHLQHHAEVLPREEGEIG